MTDKEFIIASIIQFRKTAFEVIESMCNHFELDITSDHPFLKLQSVKNNQRRGQFGNWKYRFHGGACEFIETETHQQLDLKISSKGHFDAINGYSLFRFIQTTSELNGKFPKIRESRIHEILNQLKSEEVIINVGDEYFETWILNESSSE